MEDLRKHIFKQGSIGWYRFMIVTGSSDHGNKDFYLDLFVNGCEVLSDLKYRDVDQLTEMIVEAEKVLDGELEAVNFWISEEWHKAFVHKETTRLIYYDIVDDGKRVFLFTDVSTKKLVELMIDWRTFRASNPHILYGGDYLAY